MPAAPYRYRSADEDSGRWQDFSFRAGDIVISTRSKSGTTWMQMICALLVFQTPDLPGPLSGLSPWLDWLVGPKEDVFAALKAQEHRRFIKTHTPLDRLPLEPRAELTGKPVSQPHPQPPVNEWLKSWIESRPDPQEQLDSLPGVMWHLSDAWARRHDGNVILVHFDDLRENLPGQMRRLAAHLQIAVPDAVWPRLVEAATFEHMKSRADDLVPDPSGVLRSHQAFFRTGASGSGRTTLTPAGEERYRKRAAQLAPADLLAWLHRPDGRRYSLES